MTGIIVLAAGSSSRLGHPKQNVQFKGRSLLQHAVDTAIQSGCKPVIVVLGANLEEIGQSLNSSGIHIEKNDDWAEGMSSSIRCGLTAIQKIEPTIDDVILMLCDQPFVDEGLINQILDAKQNTAKKIIASGYNDTIGPPALFDISYFPDLLLLKGQEGAKKLLLQFKDDVMTIPFPLGSVDVDTKEDLDRLKDNH